LAKVCKDSGNDVEPYWPMLFAKALKSHKIGDLLSNLGAAPAAAGPAAGGAGPAAAGAPAVEEKVEEAEDVDIGTGGFFDEEDDY
jgi:large subunit ribosomal protein LP1